MGDGAAETGRAGAGQQGGHPRRRTREDAPLWAETRFSLIEHHPEPSSPPCAQGGEAQQGVLDPVLSWSAPPLSTYQLRLLQVGFPGPMAVCLISVILCAKHWCFLSSACCTMSHILHHEGHRQTERKRWKIPQNQENESNGITG